MKPILIRIITACLLSLISLICFSQQQGNNWYFGSNAGISFNSSPPAALLNGALNTYEGCASISDNTGKLLFYTDGINVWNRNNQVMPNGAGLKGDPSSTNSAIIIPKPGSDSLYYIFTADAAENNNIKGYNYSEVDMSLNGGLGDINSNKNILLYSPSTEKLTAVRDADGIDIWVITHAWGNNAWYAYKVDCNGVSNTPVQSFAGSSYTETALFTDANGTRLINSGSVGCLKGSPDGTRIATARANLTWEIFGFDNATGLLSNGLVLPGLDAYGIEFSPDSKLVYVGLERWGYDSSNIVQYNITTYDSASISASAVKIGSSRIYTAFFGGAIGALQLGPDNKIYCALEMDSFLAVINSPNTPGISCNFVGQQVNLQGRECERGLPVFFPSLITNQNADFSFTVNNNCATVNFSGTSTISGTLVWKWDFGDGTTGIGQNIAHTYATGVPAIDTIKLTVTATTSCGTATALSIKQINLTRITPVSKFGFSLQCGNPTVTFSDSSTVSDSTIQSWLWDFGDGISSTAQSPVHLYSNYGNYNVTLSVTSAGACNGTNTSQQNVAIEAKPVAGFSYSKTCVGNPVIFTDTSAIAAGSITKWYWNLGNGIQSMIQNPADTYNQPNTYTIKLVAFSSTGCVSDTAYQTIQVSNTPTASFSVIDTCYGQASQFTGVDSVINGSISNWYWDLGDGTQMAAQDLIHTYANAGQYTVRFAAIANNGCSDTLSRIVTIGSKPIADFSFIAQCGNEQIPFTNLSSSTTGPLSQWYWDLGDGDTTVQQNPLHIYKGYGAFNVKLVSKSALGCASDTAQKILQLSAKPVAAISFKNGCINQLVSFVDSSKIAAGSIVQWYWDLGNGSSSNLQSPADTYSLYGNYNIKLVVASDQNCLSDTAIKTISIETNPVAAFTVVNGCVGKNLALQNASSIVFGSISNYYWNFGDGNSSNGQQPAYAYSQYGDFTIKEIAISKNGCLSDTAYQPIDIQSKPIVDFNFSNACLGKEINFTNLSSNAFGIIIQWGWSFGNGDTSALFEPTYTYNQFGDYQASLTVETGNGCSAVASKTISISQVIVSAGNDTIVAINEPLQLYATGAKDYLWTPPAYLNDPTSQHPIAILTQDMTYYLTGTTAGGCLGYDTISIKVFNGPDIYVPNAFTPNGDGHNDIFKPIAAGIAELDYFAVYNRWGQLVFTTKEIGKGWDGKINNVLQPADTFVWALKAKTYLGNVIMKKGTVILIR